MATFQFDTSGVVKMSPTMAPEPWKPSHWLWSWSDLSPFVQGCGSAMAQELYERLIGKGVDHGAARGMSAFRNWAPETLARVMEDCERFQAMHAWKCYAEIHPWGDPGLFDPERAGMAFWHSRNEHSHAAYGFGGGSWPKPYGQRLMEAAETFQSLTVYIGDDGKWYLREAA